MVWDAGHGMSEARGAFSAWLRPGDARPTVQQNHTLCEVTADQMRHLKWVLSPVASHAEFAATSIPAPSECDHFLFSPRAAELRERIPAELPQCLRLDEWRHPDLAANDLPSASPTFQMIADALATGDPERYQPAEPANTHWRNWPEVGTL